MNHFQRSTLLIYSVLTFFFILVDNLFPGDVLVKYAKFTAIISLFLASTRLKPKFKEQAYLKASLLFIIIGDFFLVFCSTLPQLNINLVSPFGVLGFLVAYICLIAAFQRNCRLIWGEALAAIPVLALFIPVFLYLYPHLSGSKFLGLLAFGSVLCYMAWTAISTIPRGYFNPKAARLIAAAGYLMLICDMGVAISFFHPDFSNDFVPWLKNIIWGAYIPAWTLILVLIAEENLLSNP